MVAKMNARRLLTAVVAAALSAALPGAMAMAAPMTLGSTPGSGGSFAKGPSLAQPDERIGKDVHSLSPGNLDDPGLGAAVAKKFFAEQTSALVTGHSDRAWPDALAAGPVAGKAGKPLFLTTDGQHLPTPDADYVATFINEITILGGPEVVSPHTEATWRAKGKTVRRIAGPNRFATAAMIAHTTWPQGADTVILARGDNPADAISGQPLGAKLNAPILLAEPNRLPAETRDALAKLQPKTIIVLGGEHGISQQTARQAAASAPGSTTTRIAGPTRFETSQYIADQYFADTKTVFGGLNHTPEDGTTMATGTWADMFQLAPAAGAYHAPLVLYPEIHHYLAVPIDKQVYAYDPGIKPGVAFYEHDPLWGNVDLAWRETALIRAKNGLPTLKSCTGSFTSDWQGYGGNVNQGDGSVWVNGWSAAIFVTSPGHMKVLTAQDSNYIRIVAQTLRESHGDNYAQAKQGKVDHLMDQRGLAIRVGTCAAGGKTAVPIEQRRIGPNTLSTP